MQSTGDIFLNDPVLYEQAIEPWNVICRPQNAGDFRYRMQYMTLSSIVIYREQFSLASNVMGALPEGMFAMAVPISTGKSTNYWKHPLHIYGLPAMFSGMVDVEFDNQQTQIIILIDKSLLRGYLRLDKYDHLADALNVKHVLPCNSKRIRNFSYMLQRLLGFALITLDAFDTQANVTSIEEDLLEQLDTLIQCSDGKQVAVRLPNRRRVVNLTLEYINDTGYTFLTIPEITNAVGVSQRTLEYAFQDEFGLTPLDFLRLKRMHAARRKLLAASKEEVKIGDVCKQLGFYNPGRFSVKYKQLFGESPSETLRTRPRSVSSVPKCVFNNHN